MDRFEVYVNGKRVARIWALDAEDACNRVTNSNGIDRSKVRVSAYPVMTDEK